MPYQAAYFGQKLHMDQNEKMAMYGVTYVVAIDGYSGKIVANSIMPVKNNLVIYDEVYRWVGVLTFTDVQSCVLFCKKSSSLMKFFNNFPSKLSLEYDSGLSW